MPAPHSPGNRRSLIHTGWPLVLMALLVTAACKSGGPEEERWPLLPDPQADLPPPLSPPGIPPPPGAAPLSFQLALSPAGQLASGAAPRVSLLPTGGPATEPSRLTIDWDDGAGPQDLGPVITPPWREQVFMGPVYRNPGLEVAGHVIRVTLHAGEEVQQFDLPLALGPNRPPLVSGLPVLAEPYLLSPASFSLETGSLFVFDPEGDPISFAVTDSHNADTRSFVSFPQPAAATPFTIPPTYLVDFQLYVNDPLHSGTEGTPLPVLQGTVDYPYPPSGWIFAPARQAGENDLAHRIELDASGNIYVLGSYRNNWDIGGGPRSTNGAQNGIFLASLDPEGNYRWDRTWAATGDTTPVGMGMDSAGNLTIAGLWYGSSDLGNGVRSSDSSHSEFVNDAFIARLDANGVWQWELLVGGAGGIQVQFGQTISSMRYFSGFGLAVDSAIRSPCTCIPDLQARAGARPNFRLPY